MTARRLGVLGDLVRDTIDRPGRERYQGWGGIAYSIAAAAAAAGPGWGVVPITRAAPDDHEEAAALLADLTGAPLDVPIGEAAHTASVHLRYEGDARRCEGLRGAGDAWEPEELAARVEGLDALYIDLVTGAELDARGMARLREALGDRPIHADLHALISRGEGSEGGVRTPDDARPWLAAIDVVQVNESELAVLVPGHVRPEGAATGLLNAGPEIVAVTLGAEGALVVTAHGRSTASLGGTSLPARGDGSRPVVHHFSTPRVSPVDRTGCGDVWGATFFTRLLAGDTLQAAAARANRSAGRNARHEGVAGLRGILADDRAPDSKTGRESG